MGGCCVRGCQSTTGKGQTLCRLPTAKNADKRRAAWLNFLGRPLDWKSASTSYVCELHFRTEDWEKRREDGRKKLRSNAIPTQNLLNQNKTSAIPFQDLTNFNSVQEVPRTFPSNFLAEDSVEDVPATDEIKLLIGKEHNYCKVLRETSLVTVPSPLTSTYPIQNSIDQQPPVMLSPITPRRNVASTSENSNLLTSTPLTSKMNLMDSMSELSPIPFSSTSTSIQEEFNATLNLLAAAQKENAYLKEKSKSIQKLTEEVFYLRKVCKKEQKAKERLQEKINTSRNRLSRIVSSDQYEATMRNSTQGMKFSERSIAEGLTYKAFCGTSSYDLIAKRFALPGSRALQQRTSHLKFRSGIIVEILDQLKRTVPHMKDQETDCVIGLDEMAIIPNDRLFDPSTKCPIGRATMPGHSGPATKVLAIMIGGISSRWKVLTAYYFTSSKDKKGKDKDNEQGNHMKNIIVEVLQAAEDVGLKVAAVVCDMGPDNRAMWRAFGVYAKRSGQVNIVVTNPCSPGRDLHFLPDGPHLFKNVTQMLLSNKTITLSSDIVKKCNLPTNTVDVQHIKDLMNFEKSYELKIAFRLHEQSFEKGHFEKMKMSTSRAILCHRTKVGLERLAHKTGNQAYKTTAWFVGLFVRWADLTSSRHHSLALSLGNTSAYDKAIGHIIFTSNVFQTMKVGKGDWKPAQEGVMMASHAVLKLQEHFLRKRGYKFLLTSRFTQDFVENFFSQIRRRQKLPNALMWKSIAKELTIAGVCCRLPKGSSYDDDESYMLFNLLLHSKEDSGLQTAILPSSLDLIHCPPIENDDIYNIIDDWELLVLYDMAGAALLSLTKVHNLSKDCPCIVSLLFEGPSHHPFSMVTLEKNYREGAQLEVNDKCFVALVKCEIIFRLLRTAILKEKEINVIQTVCDRASYVWNGFVVSPCHRDTPIKLVQRFLTIRFKQYGLTGKKGLENAASIFASKSLAQWALTKNIVIK